MSTTRCTWAEKPAIMTTYHDVEWGIPLWDDDRIFEFLVLETFQAGLSWLTILNRRERMRDALDGFDANIIAKYDEAKIEALLTDDRLIRNRAKVNATVTNARAFLETQAAHRSFAHFIWDFVDGVPVVSEWAEQGDVPAFTPLAVTISKALKERGFKFVGPTIVYSHMQATGLVNDHVTSCFRRAEILAESWD